MIQDKHRHAAAQLFCLVRDCMAGRQGRFILTIGGESGAGKSEVAAALAELLAAVGLKPLIIQQDDFFRFPPLTNARMRREDFNHVGTGEVRLDLLDQVIGEVRSGEAVIRKPLVIFKEDRIEEEILDLNGCQTVIFEGTYVTQLKAADCRIFIDRNYRDTITDRMARGREQQDEYLERILEKEHTIIASHKELADIIITKEFEAIRKKECR